MYNYKLPSSFGSEDNQWYVNDDAPPPSYPHDKLQNSDPREGLSYSTKL